MPLSVCNVVYVQLMPLVQVARKSCVVGAVLPARHDKKDVAACSPLMARWIELRQTQRDSRGGSSAREPHRVRCSTVEHRYVEEERLIASGAQTYRDLRRDTAKKMERWVSSFNKNFADTMHETTTARLHANLQVSALTVEQQRVLERGQSREWANYLVSLRRLDEDAGDVVALAGAQDLAHLGSSTRGRGQ